MKLLIATALMTLSLSTFADPKALVGENVSGYAQCKEETVDCTSGCEKKCEKLNPEQFKQDMKSGSFGNKKKASGKQ